MTKEVKKDVNACEDYFTLAVQCYILSAAIALFRMNTVDGNPDQDIVADDVWTKDHDERQLVLDCLCQKIVDNFVTFNFNSKLPEVKDEVHNYATEVLNLGLFYFEFIDSIKEGDGIRLLRCCKNLLLLFKSSQRPNYSIEVLNMLYQYYYLLSHRQSEQLLWSRFINTQGIKGRNIS